VYDYAEPVATSHNEVHLSPRRLPRQALDHLALRCNPQPETVAWHRDYFGNDVVFFALGEPHERLAIHCESRVEVQPRPPLRDDSPAWETVAARVRELREPASVEAVEFTFASPYVPVGAALADYARPSFPSGRPLVTGVLDLMHRIHAEFRYDPEATGIATPVDEVLRDRHGVCQDFAQVMAGCLRSLGLPARYVSGYLRSASTGADALVGAEASHAWVSAFCPVNGWIDVDPTNDVLPSDQHVVLAWGRDYEDVSPVKGVTLGGGEHRMSVRVDVRPDPAPD
jgi:transglutaminase-like putative cysteine protease